MAPARSREPRGEPGGPDSHPDATRTTRGPRRRREALSGGQSAGGTLPHQGVQGDDAYGQPQQQAQPEQRATPEGSPATDRLGERLGHSEQDPVVAPRVDLALAGVACPLAAGPGPGGPAGRAGHGWAPYFAGRWQYSQDRLANVPSCANQLIIWWRPSRHAVWATSHGCHLNSQASATCLRQPPGRPPHCQGRWSSGWNSEKSRSTSLKSGKSTYPRRDSNPHLDD